MQLKKRIPQDAKFFVYASLVNTPVNLIIKSLSVFVAPSLLKATLPTDDSPVKMVWYGDSYCGSQN